MAWNKANSDDSFGIYISHGGHFAKLGNDRVYAGGAMDSALNLERDMFGLADLEFELSMLGYVSWKGISYKVPKTEVYKDIHNSEDVTTMLSHLSDTCRVLNIFVDGGKLASGREDDGQHTTGLDDDDMHMDEWNGYQPQLDSEGHLLEKDQDEDNELDIEGQFLEADEGKGNGVSQKKTKKVQTCEKKNTLTSKKKKAVSKGKEKSVSERVMAMMEQYNSSEDSDYIPEVGEDYTDDEMADDELEGDEEYTNARRLLRDKSDRGLCDEVFARVGHECGFSDYEDEDGDIYSSETDEDDDGDRVKRRIRRVVYDPRTENNNLKLEVGMRFDDGFQLRDAIREYSIADSREVKFRSVTKDQMRAICKDPCKLRCYGSRVKATGQFIIKTLNDTHTCIMAMRNKQVTSTWIANKYLNVFRYRPDITVKELAMDIRARYNCHVGNWKLYKSRAKAIDMLRGTVEEHYAKLRSYVLELMRADKEGRFELNLAVGAVFKGLYIGFSALKNGFKAGCRRVIGVDGAFLKTYLGGVLLCAVGQDANNGMFPIAWAVVEVENQENWRWFLRILVDDIGLSTGAGFTFISDQQKGLLNAIAEVAPLAVHRNCARHVYMNWKKGHKGKPLKNMFWKVVRSTNLQEYNEALNVMKKENAAAYADFIERDTTKFCKCFIDPGTVSDVILNNISETFNGYILTSRGKHLIHMLEEIRTSLMERVHRKKSELVGYAHRICPEIFNKLEKIQRFSRYCICYASSDVLFEVENYGDRFILDMVNRTCSCRAWDISGIPCIHACAAIHFQWKRAVDYVNEWYSVEKYEATYNFGLPPLNGEKMWHVAEGYPVLPPPAKKMPGRPKKKRNRDPCEANPQNPNKLRRNGVIMTCQNCFQQGHNQRRCKNEPIVREPVPKGKVGRPRKNPLLQPTNEASAAGPSTSAAGASTATASKSKASNVSKRRGKEGMAPTASTAGASTFAASTMPTEKTSIFIPSRPSTEPAKTKKKKKKFIATQESHNL